MTRLDRLYAELELRSAWRRLFLTDDGSFTEDGFAVIRDIEAMCFGTRTTATGAPIDPLQMAMNEGRRSAFMDIKKRIMTPLDEYQNAIVKEESK